MLTKSGMGMAAGLALCLVGVIGLIVAIRQYRHKGSVFDAAYFAAPKPEREKLKTNKAYRYAGNLFLCWPRPVYFWGFLSYLIRRHWRL